jgi:hypothetical protein
MAKQNSPRPSTKPLEKEERGNKGRTTPKPSIKPRDKPSK